MEHERRKSLLKARADGANQFPIEEINRRAYEYACEACREQIAIRNFENRET